MRYISFFLLLIILGSCGSSRLIVPLGRKERAVGVSGGGALFDYKGSIIPVPLTSLNYAQGISKHLTGFGSLHLTSMAYGTYHLELGVLNEWLYHQKKKWGLTSNLVGNFMLTHNDWKFRFYPELDVNFYWHFWGDPHYHCDCPGDRKTLQFVYVGLGSWFDLSKRKSNGEPVNSRVLVNPHFGYSIGNAKNRYRLEGKYIAPWLKNDNTVIDYFNPISTYGAIGVYLSYNRVF